MAGWTVDTVLNRAISMERQSYDLYVWAQGRVENPEAKRLLGDLAKEERRHRAKLSAALRDKEKLQEIGSKAQRVQDLKIVDWLGDVRLSEDSDYQDILIFAGKREKETYEYYSELAERLGETRIGQLFSKLAQEELAHKNKIEKEYQKYILQ
ncbi:MAG: ferritin family protein [Candidatus Bathyarchaeia archaeon]